MRKIFYFALSFLLTLTGAGLMQSCQDNIDEGNFAIKTQQSLMEYIGTNPELSSLATLLNRVQFGHKEQASPLSAVLAARGTYTVFAPNNEAIDSFMVKNDIPCLDSINDEMAELITYSCIIDNEDTHPYETPDFPTPGTFTKTNLNNRSIKSSLDQNGFYVINDEAPVVKENVEALNGFLHIVSRVIAPSNKNIYELVTCADNMQIISHLMAVTGYDSVMSIPSRDLAYERENHPLVADYKINNYPMKIPQYRYLGCTAFLETDSTFEAEWNLPVERDAEGTITNFEQLMPIITAKCENLYQTGGAAADNLKDGDNAVNRFVSYHFIDGKMAYDKLVRHYNEYGYDMGSNLWQPQTKYYPTNLTAYFTTLGKYPQLMKITQVGEAGMIKEDARGIFINRISKHRNGRNDDYQEIAAPVRGIRVYDTNLNYDNNAINGYYLPIKQVLAFDENTRINMGKERIRLEMMCLLPELISSNLRGAGYMNFPHGFCANLMNESKGTKNSYICGAQMGTAGWAVTEGDHFDFCGLYDFVLRMPPVPRDGTYELRMGVHNYWSRGMTQIYFGEDINDLTPCGLPVDMRLTPGPDNIACPWIEDTDDDDFNIENDRNLRNQRYMKGPRFYTTNRNKETNFRNDKASMRFVIDTRDMKADRSYYIRFKSVLKSLTVEHYVDYFEYVPKNIYNGPIPEDVW